MGPQAQEETAQPVSRPQLWALVGSRTANKVTTTRGPQCSGLVTYLLEPQVGLHDLVYLILERQVKADA